MFSNCLVAVNCQCLLNYLQDTYLQLNDIVVFVRINFMFILCLGAILRGFYFGVLC